MVVSGFTVTLVNSADHERNNLDHGDQSYLAAACDISVQNRHHARIL
jgi:hypothetical protein